MGNAGLKLFISEAMLRLGVSITSQLETRAGFLTLRIQNKLWKSI
jgi:hypothetical protein